MDKQRSVRQCRVFPFRHTGRRPASRAFREELVCQQNSRNQRTDRGSYIHLKMSF